MVPEIGERYLGTVVREVDFGAFISLTPGKDGLLHVTQLRKLNSGKRVENVEDVAKVGQKVEVEIREIDGRGKISLAVIEDEAESADAPAEETSAEGSGRSPAARLREGCTPPGCRPRVVPGPAARASRAGCLQGRRCAWPCLMRSRTVYADSR